MNVYTGAEISDELLRAMFDVYLTTIENNPYGRQYLNVDFFERLGGAFRQHLCFVTAERLTVYGDWCCCIAALLTMRSCILLLLPLLHVNTTGRGVDRRHIQRCKGANCLHCTGFSRYVQRQSSCINVKSVVPPTSLLSDSRAGRFYGRYWGTHEFVKNLHFETCYYKSIEYCIEQGLDTMEPGAGGGDFKFLR
eukprot:19344-Heterococcus_DN1.PRE.1